MPAKYPAIAPRGPNSAAQAEQKSAQELQPVDDAGQAGRLAELRANPEAFVDAHHPVRDAVTIALQQPAGALLRRHAARQRAYRAALAEPAASDDPDERPPQLEDDDGLPAIIAMAESQVALALLGDSKAFNAVSDRVEGKAGLRKADLDAETEAQRQRMRVTIEQLVRDMGERRTRGDDARVIDVDASTGDAET